MAETTGFEPVRRYHDDGLAIHCINHSAKSPRWCSKWDSNPHGFCREILSLLCLPISPFEQKFRGSGLQLLNVLCTVLPLNLADLDRQSPCSRIQERRLLVADHCTHLITRLCFLAYLNYPEDTVQEDQFNALIHSDMFFTGAPT